MIGKMIRYYSNLLFYPQYRDFVNMGLGIEARYSRCAKYWEPHIQCCKEFQRRALLGINDLDRVSVLGAGRLLDINLGLLLNKFKRIDLYDADPGALEFWKSCSELNYASSEINFELIELSGLLGSWTELLSNFLRSNKNPDNDKLVTFLRSLPVTNQASILFGSDCIYSFNLLSQLPLYWRDRFELLVKKYWKLESDEHGKYENTLQCALENSFAKLQQGHLDMLAGSGARVILLSSDLNFYYYTSDRASWQVEKAIFHDYAEFEKNSPSLPGYQIDQRDSWLWHIAPQEVEYKDYGALHEVRCFAMKAG